MASITVSYTHLDVYKRQIILSISLLIAPGAIAVLLTQRFHIALLLATGISVIVSMTGVWSVSYTHLDVYKRQTLG